MGAGSGGGEGGCDGGDQLGGSLAAPAEVVEGRGKELVVAAGRCGEEVGVFSPFACFSGGGRERGVSCAERRRRGCRKGGNHCDIHRSGAGREQGGQQEVSRTLLTRHRNLFLAWRASLVRQGGQGVPEGVVALVLADVLAGKHVVPESVYNKATCGAWPGRSRGVNDGEAKPPGNRKGEDFGAELRVQRWVGVQQKPC